MAQALISPTGSFLARPTIDYPHLSKMEYELLLGKAHTQTRLLIKTLWWTGARISEVLRITRNDLDGARAVINMITLKRRKPFRRELPVPPELINELEIFAQAKGRTGRIFPTDRFAARRAVVCVAAKILNRHVSPKYFRHGRAYEMLSRGVRPDAIAKLFGHASLNTILSYGHPTLSDLRQANLGE